MTVTTESTTGSSIDNTKSIEEKIADLEKPWKDAEVLETLYWKREMSTREVGDELGTSHVTIGKWLDRHNLPTRNRGEAISIARRNGYATYRIDDYGYERWIVEDPDKCRAVRVHQLLVISEGMVPEQVFSDGEYHCHHKNGIKWDNRPSNIELVTAEEHGRIH